MAHIQRFKAMLLEAGISPTGVLADEESLRELAFADRDEIIDLLKAAGVTKVGVRIKLEQALRERPGENAPPPRRSPPKPPSTDAAPASPHVSDDAASIEVSDEVRAEAAEILEDFKALMTHQLKAAVSDHPYDRLMTHPIDLAAATSAHMEVPQDSDHEDDDFDWPGKRPSRASAIATASQPSAAAAATVPSAADALQALKLEPSPASSAPTAPPVAAGPLGSPALVFGGRQ